ncbi:glycosyltransferase family 39 protein [Dactylosporangium matsuzakiense]|nr:glycosyltransferase family 39 protein [Dactylosporangium matsuzakiense]
MKRPNADPWGEDWYAPDELDINRKRLPRFFDLLPWVVPGLVMGLVGGIGIGRPALWSDELATWGMATTPWAGMFKILQYVDLIIGPYYVVAHAWSDLDGASDAAIRVPSLLAMIGAAALVGALGTRLGGRRVGLLAGLLFAVLPGSSRYAQEARVYALVTLFAVLSTFALVSAVKKPHFARYCGYALAVVLLGVLHPIALLLLAAHGWVVFAQYRRQVAAWLSAALLGSLPALPLLYLGNRQKAQVSWIPTPDGQTLLDFPKELAGVTAAGVLLLALGLFSLPLRRRAAFYTAWAILPLLGLFAAGQFTPLFLARYLLFTLPAWALLAAAAVGRVRLVWGLLAVGAVATFGIPQQMAIREPDGHGEAGHDVAAIITDNSHDGDAIVYGMADAGGNWVGRDTITHYVPAAQRPKDVLATKPSRADGNLAAEECQDVAKCLGTPPRVWVIRLGYLPDPLTALDGAKEPVLRERYQVEQVWRPRGFTVALATMTKPAG